MIYIRTDANNVIATGHVMRCLTIAEELVYQKKKVCFVVSDEESTALIKDTRYPIIVTNSKWDQVDVEVEYALLSQYAKKGDILIIDSYFLHSDYSSKMRKIFKVVVFDDMFSEKKSADIVINYNVFYRNFDYKKRYQNDDCQLLLGEKYVPLRSQFRSIKPNDTVRESACPKVLLMCGGGDKEDMILKSLRWLEKYDSEIFSQIQWNIVVGSYYPSKEKLDRFIRLFPNIKLFVNIENMAQLMQKCDICITAASTVLYECCAMQLPTLFFVVAEDQKYDAEFFTKNDMMIYCGNFKANMREALMRMDEQLCKLLLDKRRQQNMKKLMSDFVDGYGVERIVQALIGGEKYE